MNVTTIVGAIVVLAGAWYLDGRSWKKKPREELVRMAEGDDWRCHKPAIIELRRRGEDVRVYLPRIVAKLLSESKIEREAAHMVVKDCFPDLAAEIKGYKAFSGIESCRERAAPLLSRFGVNL